MVIILVIWNYSIQGNPELELSVGYIYIQPDKRSSLFQQATILEIHPQQLIQATTLYERSEEILHFATSLVLRLM